MMILIHTRSVIIPPPFPTFIFLKSMITMIMMILLSRRVYNRATAPRLGVLAPEMDDDGGLVLSYVDLPFAEDRRELQFAPLTDPRCWFFNNL